MSAMKPENKRHILESAAVLACALAALAFYSVRDFLAAFVLFSFVFLAFGAALLLIVSAEEALVWVMRRTETYFAHFRARHFAVAGHSAHRRS
jgi:predicted lysophospholipase L1 biosynthesis ABC-type transport system permease subunit